MLYATTQIRNPKRGKESRIGRASWYDYYAGFSTTFVQDALRIAAPNPPARVLDPWNGSGTTTEIAAALGFEAIGFDLNPAMVIVAKARLLDSTVQGSLTSILDDLLTKTPRSNEPRPDEPLTNWFTAGSAAVFRGFEREIQKLLINQHDHRLLFDLPTLNHVSSLAAFFYVAAFRVIRELLNPFRSANPTWLKQPAIDERIRVSEKRLHEMLRNQVNKMADELTATPIAVKQCNSTIEKGGSTAIPISSCSIDAVISSPPYCTRIDYVKKTGPELAFLGAKAAAVRSLRDQMIGTPTIQKETPQSKPSWGGACIEAVEAISNHNSYASRSYYWKTYVQYFNGLHDSLREIDRTLKSSGACILVIQDSYYKDMHIDLARMIEEMARGLAWEQTNRTDFPTTKTIVGLNAYAMGNGNPRKATETVLGFRKRH